MKPNRQRSPYPSSTVEMWNQIVDHYLASWSDRMYSFHCTVDVNIIIYGSAAKNHFQLSFVLVTSRPMHCTCKHCTCIICNFQNIGSFCWWNIKSSSWFVDMKITAHITLILKVQIRAKRYFWHYCQKSLYLHIQPREMSKYDQIFHIFGVY